MKLKERNKMFDEHYRINFETLVKKIRSFAGSHHAAEDVVQEAYTRAIRSYDDERVLEFNPWFNTILANSLKDNYANRRV
jgi:RNA polymerase sigma factor (sigma-70 family)